MMRAGDLEKAMMRKIKLLFKFDSFFEGDLLTKVVDRGLCPTKFCSYSVPKKYIEVYVNHKLIGLLAQDSY